MYYCNWRTIQCWITILLDLKSNGNCLVAAEETLNAGGGGGLGLGTGGGRVSYVCDYGIAIYGCGEMIISAYNGHQICIRFNTGEQKIRTFGSLGYGSEQMIFPKGRQYLCEQ